MDPRYFAQDVLRCDLCEIHVVQSHCELCHVNLCKACVGEHLSDSNKKHRVVPYRERTSTPIYPKCLNHSKNCELYCEQCDIPVCSTCISSGKHKGHHLSDVLQKLSSKSRDMEKELRELETTIYPKYEEIASGIKTKKDNLETHYRNLTTAVTKQGELWHRKINIIVNKQKSEIDEMKTKHIAALNTEEDVITKITEDVKQSIDCLKKILDSNDISLASEYKSRIAEFRSLPPDLKVILPSFSPQWTDSEKLYHMFGSLSALTITKEEHGYTMKTSETVSCLPVKPLLDEPEAVTTIDTGYEYTLCSVTCLSDEEIWTLGGDKIMKLYNLHGKLLKSIQTKSGNTPHDIAVTRSGDLVYTDPDTRTVNIVKNEKIQEVIRLQGWKPYYLCSTSSGDLLVIMDNDENKQKKVIRYSGSIAKQTIQFDSEGRPLYSSGSVTYICENRNLDICVADNKARAVMVVNQAGKFRFRYTGHPTTTKELFDPLGITTDTQRQILISDFDYNCIHILDQDGHFLRYIDNCGLEHPWGICIDTSDNLFVAEWKSGKTPPFSAESSEMDPRYSAQDIIRCDLCERHVVQSHCELCHVNLCKTCVGEHLSDSTKKHRVVPYKERTSTPNYPKCLMHSKNCELYCEQCDIPVCSTCISSGKHKGHHLLDILQKLSSKTRDMEEELIELETEIYPKYEEIASGIKNKKENVETQYRKLKAAVSKQEEDWHREINIIVNKRKSEIDEMKSKHLAALSEEENKIKHITAEVKQSIIDQKKILQSNDISLASVYKSRNAEFRRLPPEVNVSLPSFSPQQINTEQLHQMFGFLSALSITTEHGYTMKTPEDVSCPPVKPLLDEPQLISTIDTGYKPLRSVTFLRDDEIWTCGNGEIIKLYNFQGKLLKSITTQSGRQASDITVTRSGDLIYIDRDTRTVNIVKNKQIQEVIRLQGWTPYNVCSTSSGDLLVTMNSEDDTHTKVVRYSGSYEKQTIQFDSKGNPLYSSSDLFKSVTENRNLDICVADHGARAVVVVNQAGKLRFRYTGPPFTIKGVFLPYGITTDSQSQILTADSVNNCIYILDQDGQFLRHIDNCDLQYPWGLCVDIRDNLFVTENITGKVKKIKYM
ncbi:uncharacterized protein LOC134266460 [Saccostrea cucullata]|uniref:uncharacterized protein LOC134266460 n=1 Tax=Saccostrea cuccullata TaxID=36930 RepID=UPI002ED45FEF